VALAVWGAAKQSVTFDENFHLPAGAVEVAHGELRVSAVNPPLVKALGGLAAIVAGAHVPPMSAFPTGEQGEVGEIFMHANEDRYQRIFFAARLVTVLLSVLLGLVVWRWSRRLWGARAALVSLGFFAFAPEALAHAGVMTMDVPTALGFTASLAAWQGFVTSGRWRAWGVTAGAVAFTFLVRLTALFLPPLLLVLAVVELLRKRVRSPRRLWLGLALLALSTFTALHAGYLFRTSFAPIKTWHFESNSFKALQQRMPELRLPLPDTWVTGLDRQSMESLSGRTPCYFMGKELPQAPLAYYPVALLIKWPLGFLAALLVLAVYVAKRRPPWHRLLWPLALALAFVVIVVFVGRMGIGIRYLFPVVPALAVCLGAVASGRGGASPRWRQAIVALAAVQAIEASAHAPWHLSFFNVLAGGPERAQFIVNDSNIDWGQGLIALREEMAKRGIHRIYLTYHGTADPALYGIDNVPYMGGLIGQDSDWIAVSSYYFVGLTQRMMLHDRRTDRLRVDFHALWSRRADATPAGCMLLFRLR
jgi:4-amino-4-deoxy-L-arabinose transferase-like glycosyltransferase